MPATASPSKRALTLRTTSRSTWKAAPENVRGRTVPDTNVWRPQTPSCVTRPDSAEPRLARDTSGHGGRGRTRHVTSTNPPATGKLSALSPDVDPRSRASTDQRRTPRSGRSPTRLTSIARPPIGGYRVPTTSRAVTVGNEAPPAGLASKVPDGSDPSTLAWPSRCPVALRRRHRHPAAQRSWSRSFASGDTLVSYRHPMSAARPRAPWRARLSSLWS